jgi:hypothetical protein
MEKDKPIIINPFAKKEAPVPRKNWEVPGMPETSCFSYTNIKVLPELTGRKLDDLSWGLIHALRPSVVEVFNDDWWAHCNAITWRVRVFCKDSIISFIEQEVKVGMYGNIKNGGDLSWRLKEEKKREKK